MHMTELRRRDLLLSVASIGLTVTGTISKVTAQEKTVLKVKEAQPHVTIHRIEAGFEEIFIYLMSGSVDNFQ